MDDETEIQRGIKRRKEDQEEPQRHDILWFPDGNVVLATDKYLFKVYKGLLSMHSSVFKDMFELPNVGESNDGQSDGGTVQEMYEGVPLVTLVGDKGEDVACLLRALYEHRYYNRDDPDTPLDVIVALLVLSAKYNFKDLMKDVVMQISKEFPMSLDDMDTVIEEEDKIFGEDHCRSGFRLLEAAFTSGVDALLPILFFFCSNVSLDTLYEAARPLHPECLQILIKGRENWTLAMYRIVSDLPETLKADIGNSKCADERPCNKKARYRGLSNFIIPSFERLAWIECEYLDSICKRCRSSVAMSIEKKRKEIWVKIPSFFGYTGWDVAQEKLDELMTS